MENKKKYSFETYAVTGARKGDAGTGAISYPLYLSATFKHEGLNQSTGYDYTRLQNPTREEVEKTIALLENGREGLAFSCGMAALTACVHLFKPGDHVILSEDLYGGTFRLFDEVYSVYNIESSFVDTSDIDKVKDAIRKNTKGIVIETPSNPLMRVTDIKAITDICKEKDIISIVDNTFLTPYYQKPLELGADIVIHSATKYLGGHNDLLAGFAIANDKKIIEKLRFMQKSTGAILSPFDSWLLLRGIKTLHIRMDRIQENALKIAKWLEDNKKIEKVYYVGLNTHQGYYVNKEQSTGFGGMISFRVKDKKYVEDLLSNLKVISFAESLGGVESLITYPFTQTHSEMLEEIKNRLGVDEYLMRLSVGIENVNDLINDLKSVLE